LSVSVWDFSALPLGLLLISSGVDGVFARNAASPNYIASTAARLVGIAAAVNSARPDILKGIGHMPHHIAAGVVVK
jgi:hypothetical protein